VDAEVVEGGQRRQRLGDRRIAGDQQPRRRQERLDVDLECPAAVAGHDVLHHALLGRQQPGLGAQANQACLSVRQGAQPLALDRRLGAAPADPADQLAARQNDGTVAGPRRGRAAGSNDRRERDGLAALAQLTEAAEHVHAPDYWATPFSWRIW
jgi:hypothetical protein